MAANRIRQDGQDARGIRAARRTLMYIVRVMLLLLAGALVCALAFLTAERMSNLYILSTEGMSLRAESILTDDVEPGELEEYFLLAFLADDTALTADAYRGLYRQQLRLRPVHRAHLRAAVDGDGHGHGRGDGDGARRV